MVAVDRVYAVHTTRPEEVGAIEIIFAAEDEARSYARQRSRDARFLAASVTCYLVGILGSRKPLCWFVNGAEQDPRTPRQYCPTAGPVPVDDRPGSRTSSG